jgi:hypothetical protein
VIGTLAKKAKTQIAVRAAQSLKTLLSYESKEKSQLTPNTNSLLFQILKTKMTDTQLANLKLPTKVIKQVQDCMEVLLLSFYD